jgi:putative transposase
MWSACLRAALPLRIGRPAPRSERWRRRDAAYDSNALRPFLSERGTLPVISNNPTRKNLHPFDRSLYRARNLIEPMFCRLNWRRDATGYDKLANTFTASVHFAAIVTWWT